MLRVGAVRALAVARVGVVGPKRAVARSANARESKPSRVPFPSPFRLKERRITCRVIKMKAGKALHKKTRRTKGWASAQKQDAPAFWRLIAARIFLARHDA